MDDFFKELRNNLENRPEPASEERDWRDLQKRLDQQDKKRLAGFVWWWLALPLLLLLLGLNGAFFYELKKANQKSKTIEIQIDTIYKTQVIYQTDTIYKTRIIRETLVEYRASDAGTPTNLPQLQQTPTISVLEETPFKNVTLQELDTFNFNKNSNNQIILTDIKKLQKLNLDTLSVPIPDLPKLSEERIVKKPKKTLRQHVYAMRPKGFQLGINGGAAFPFSSQGTPIPGFLFGLQGIVELSPNLQLWTDATYSNTRFETNRMDAAIGVPPIEPPSDEFEFVLAEVPQPALQFSLGMQYFLNIKNKIQPFIGAGVGAVSLLPHEVIYEFKNDRNGIEWSLDKAVSSDEILTNFWFARAGLAYEISERLQGQFLTTYRGNWKTQNIQFPQLLGIQLGVNYRLK